MVAAAAPLLARGRGCARARAACGEGSAAPSLLPYPLPAAATQSAAAAAEAAGQAQEARPGLSGPLAKEAPPQLPSTSPGGEEAAAQHASVRCVPRQRPRPGPRGLRGGASRAGASPATSTSIGLSRAAEGAPGAGRPPEARGVEWREEGRKEPPPGAGPARRSSPMEPGSEAARAPPLGLAQLGRLRHEHGKVNAEEEDGAAGGGGLRPGAPSGLGGTGEGRPEGACLALGPCQGHVWGLR